MKTQWHHILFILLLPLFLKADLSQAPLPELQEPIHLFKNRDLGFLLKELNRDVAEDIIAWLSSSEARNLLHQVSGDIHKREIGHQEYRKESYTGKLVSPDLIVLTSSNKETLEETVNDLTRQALSHNFIIDKDGKTYPITAQNESLDKALSHRPFAVGISAATLDGFTQCRDMNAHSITISLVGIDTNTHTEQQYQSLIELVRWLSQKFSINRRNVKVYGAIAYPYTTPENPVHGRRKITPSITAALKVLAQHNLALWPTASNSVTAVSDEKNLCHWVSGALRKIGFICPDTEHQNHPDLIAALRKFGQLYNCDNQESFVTSQTLDYINSILQQCEQDDARLKLIWPRPIGVENQNESQHTIFDPIIIDNSNSERT